MSQTPVSLIDVSTYLPGEPIGAEYYAQFAESDELRDNVMFRAPAFRHHVAPEESAIDMIERAAQGLIERHGEDVVAGADVLITHTQVPDMAFYGEGGGIAHRLGMRPSWVLDLNNGGCAAICVGAQCGSSVAGVRGWPHRADRHRAKRRRAGLRSAKVCAAKRSRRCPATARRWAWSRWAINRPFSTSSAAPMVNTLARWCSSPDPPRKWWQAGGGRALHRIHRKQDHQGAGPRQPSGPRGRVSGVSIESDCPPRTSTCLSPTSPTGRFCATGGRRSNCPRNVIATPSTSAATCSVPESRSTWITRYRTVR